MRSTAPRWRLAAASADVDGTEQDLNHSEAPRQRGTHGADVGREAAACDRPRRRDSACRPERCGCCDGREHSGNHCAVVCSLIQMLRCLANVRWHQSRAGVQLAPHTLKPQKSLTTDHLETCRHTVYGVLSFRQDRLDPCQDAVLFGWLVGSPLITAHSLASMCIGGTTQAIL